MTSCKDLVKVIISRFDLASRLNLTLLDTVIVNTILISALRKPDSFPHDTENIELIETHISWIILTGDIAYKIKKPVNFGFLDFTSLHQRKQYCEAELSLNSRSAPEIYLGLVGISGTPEAPVLHPSSDDTEIEGVFEYAVKMNQFERGQLFSELAESEQLNFGHVEELADKVSQFHRMVTPSNDLLVEHSNLSSEHNDYGNPERVYAPMKQNFEQITAMLDDTDLLQQLNQLEAWTESSFERLRPMLEQRKSQGFVRNCHGDLHLGNLTIYAQNVTLFDCIEFNDDFRWIDVISDIAFLVMDFEVHELPHFANRFLNNYLEQTGDYAGLQLLYFYKAYRAVVRAKIALLSMQSSAMQSSSIQGQDLSPEQKDKFMRQYTSYIDLAESYTRLPNRFVLTMHGVSGTGKSTVALRLVDRLGVIRIRSDVERKRLFGIDPHDHPGPELALEMYSDDASLQTYDTLATLCGYVLDAALCVVVDATNLKYWQRECLQQVADARGVPLCIAYCQASMPIIREWIQKRKNEDIDVSDADFSTVDKQIRLRDSLNAEELQQTFVIHSNVLDETNELVSQIKQRFM